MQKATLKPTPLFGAANQVLVPTMVRLRYCEADPQIIWNKVDFNQYRDMIISAELIYRDYIELMEELDIRDGYELFYIIKSSLDNWDNKDFDISCRRVPVMVLGDGDEAKQALHLLKEISLCVRIVVSERKKFLW